MTTVDRLDAVPAGRGKDQTEFQVLFVLTFVFFLLAEIVTRILSAREPGIRRNSIFGAAKATAYSTLAIAFMG
jgi:hypothetical protein